MSQSPYLTVTMLLMIYQALENRSYLFIYDLKNRHLSFIMSYVIDIKEFVGVLIFRFICI